MMKKHKSNKKVRKYEKLKIGLLVEDLLPHTTPKKQIISGTLDYKRTIFCEYDRRWVKS
ncbi:MAG: hypothetical protein RSE57_00470 [Clostridia bacterium]